MLFPIWPNGLAQTLVAIKGSPLILSKGLDGFTVLLQTADGAGRVHRARGGAHPLVRVPAVVHATGEAAGSGGAGATAGRPQALKAGALPLAFAGPLPLEIGAPTPALAEVFPLVGANLLHVGSTP